MKDFEYNGYYKHEDIPEIEKLLSTFDFYAAYIGNLSQRQEAFKKNQQIREKLDNLGIAYFNKL